MEILVYTQKNCGYCTQAKEYLTTNNIKYIDINIHETKDIYNEFQKLGGKATPFIVKKNGTTVIDTFTGFNKEKIKELIN